MKQFPQPLRREAELPFAEHGGPPKEKRPAADKAPGAVADLQVRRLVQRFHEADRMKR